MEILKDVKLFQIQREDKTVEWQALLDKETSMLLTISRQ